MHTLLRAIFSGHNQNLCPGEGNPPTAQPLHSEEGSKLDGTRPSLVEKAAVRLLLTSQIASLREAANRDDAASLEATGGVSRVGQETDDGREKQGR